MPHPILKGCVCPICKAHWEKVQAQQALYATPTSSGPQVTRAQLNYLRDLIEELDMSEGELLDGIAVDGEEEKLEDLTVARASELIDELKTRREQERRRER